MGWQEDEEVAWERKGKKGFALFLTGRSRGDVASHSLQLMQPTRQYHLGYWCRKENMCMVSLVLYARMEERCVCGLVETKRSLD